MDAKEKPHKFCDCEVDGYCARYNREMGGRMRDICAGRGVDLGTAAAFREQWARERAFGPVGKHPLVSTQTYHSPGYIAPPKPLLLKQDQAPGDAVAMTAAIYSLHRAHPGKYLTAVESKFPEVFAHNPDVATIENKHIQKYGYEAQMHYPAIHKSNERAIHFMQGWCEFLGSALGIEVPLLTNRPHLYFADSAPPVGVFPQGDYWVICSGGKRDFTNKLWGHHNYQWVIDRLVGDVDFVQVGGESEDHPRLAGVVDVVGQTSLRQLFDIVRRARGVVCGVSLLMHVAAALEKPAVVIAGGREPVAWNAYPKQQYMHTVGALNCSTAQSARGGACWRSRVVPLNDGSFLDCDTCERPVGGLPECMRMIRPNEVAEMVLRYNYQYEQGIR